MIHASYNSITYGVSCDLPLYPLPCTTYTVAKPKGLNLEPQARFPYQVA